MFSRELVKALLNYKNFPVIALLGPRQSGKTTLVKTIFENHLYLSFEHESTRSLAEQDPERFLEVNENKYGIIIDEFQHVPKLLSYIQLEVDLKKRPAYFILTGSQNFLMNQAITQSLAGRVGILTLLPLSIYELQENKLLSDKVDDVLYAGSYPRLYDQNIKPTSFYPSYVQTYIERDVRQLINVENLKTFQRFIQLCAGRIGQLLNIDALGSEVGISFHTARSWLSILEASYIIFLLEPHFKNFNKRITKSPKLYFYDTGLACSLLRITSPTMLALHPLRGSLFENLIIADLHKQYYNIGMRPSVYFWRDQNGRYEVDCIIDEGIKLIPVEIKSSLTISTNFFNGLTYWNELANTNPEDGFVVYTGRLTQARRQGTIISWKDSGSLIEMIHKRMGITI